jgi:hypothetical protein
MAPTTIGERRNGVNVNGAAKNGESMKGVNTSDGSDTVPEVVWVG